MAFSHHHAEVVAHEGHRLQVVRQHARQRVEGDVQVAQPQGRQQRVGLVKVVLNSGDAIGEICVRGPDVFAGYWRAPDQTRLALGEDRWLRTGDLARVDAEGYIFIVDRKKEMLVSGGFNIYPSEVESVLAQHPAVYEVCVVGVPDERWGEAVKAVVVLRDGSQASGGEIMDYCRGRLADFKRPRSVDFVPQLPKNSNGKLSRKDVREHYWHGRERRVN
jgi:acyl-CoA synthetase (AMP-forming)/AMP-acid ligase II